MSPLTPLQETLSCSCQAKPVGRSLKVRPSLFKALLPFTNTFDGLFTRRINEISQEDLGNNSSGIPGSKKVLKS